MHGGDHFFAPHDLGRRDVVDRILGADSHLLRGGTMKVFLDRVYPDGPAMYVAEDGCTRRHVGSPFWGPEEAAGISAAAARLGIAVAMHAMGNGAVQTAIDAFTGARRHAGDDRVLRIEHANVAEPEQARRLGSLGVDVVMGPGILAGDAVHIMEAWRPPAERDRLRLIPIRSMIDAGVRVSIASDYPCGEFAPAEMMWCAVTRRHSSGALIDPEEAVTAAEALRALTVNPAHACGRESEEGSIEVGKRANLAVLDRDPITCPTDDIRGMLVDRTYVDGRLVHSRPDADRRPD
jgi:predicted amidohydrolase YtcJ